MTEWECLNCRVQTRTGYGTGYGVRDLRIEHNLAPTAAMTVLDLIALSVVKRADTNWPTLLHVTGTGSHCRQAHTSPPIRVCRRPLTTMRLYMYAAIMMTAVLLKSRTASAFGELLSEPSPQPTALLPTLQPSAAPTYTPVCRTGGICE